MTLKKRISSLILMLVLVAGAMYLGAQVDHIPPVISGVADKTIIIGDAVLYKDGVSAEDDRDGTVRFTVDSSAVNPVLVGDYTVIYTASDKAGNITSITAVYTFVEPEPVLPPMILQRYLITHMFRTL